MAAASIYGKLATQNEICFEAPRQRMPYIAIQIKRKQRPAGGATAAAPAAGSRKQCRGKQELSKAAGEEESGVAQHLLALMPGDVQLI